MEIYLDSANLSQIEHAVELGILDGVTTNPTLIAKEGGDFENIIRKISQVIKGKGKIWAEVISTKSEAMVEEAIRMTGWATGMVVKLPMGLEGIKAASILSREGIQTNMTLISSVSQALLAAKAGVSYVSPYAGRVDDIGWSGSGLIQGIVEAFSAQGFATKILAASVRSPHQAAELVRSGVDGITVPYGVLIGMAQHPMTDLGLDQFLKDWSEAGLQ
ncbi:Transaldolase [Rubrobacter xylanophilus DSM 9941]|uniref:transaldolase family protein n=1 Tax=Rubrobacter xylanophilus TaxID=49319 RepID=UPI001C63DDCA|nr:transaldolase family protein [Rubrobacter xylanophilus]QYJ17123.1 Transaldolase [Rubrobacter xylanophilus DSM 9941]